jgi:hypothetical protein
MGAFCLGQLLGVFVKRDESLTVDASGAQQLTIGEYDPVKIIGKVVHVSYVHRHSSHLPSLKFTIACVSE